MEIIAESKETRANPDTRQALLDAMRAVQDHMIQQAGGTSELINNRDDLLARISKGKCGFASIDALAYLTQRHPDLFTTMVVVTSWHSIDRLFRDQNNDFHTFLLAREKSGTWHAISPANRGLDQNKSPFTTIITGENLDDVIDAIERQEGGIWPAAKYILWALESSQYVAPAISEEEGKKELTATLIDNKFGIDQMLVDHHIDLPIIYQPVSELPTEF